MADHRYQCEQAQDRAVKAFVHYMTLLFDAAKLQRGRDQRIEWEGIIEDVIEASAHRAAVLIAEEQEKRTKAALEALRPLACQRCTAQMTKVDGGWHCPECELRCDQDGDLL